MCMYIFNFFPCCRNPWYSLLLNRYLRIDFHLSDFPHLVPPLTPDSLFVFHFLLQFFVSSHFLFTPLSAHIFSPSAVCSCDPYLWKGCGAVPVCVLVCLDVGGMLWDGIIVGFMYFEKIPSPCFHGNPSISVNPGDSEQASNLWHDLSPHLSSGNPAAQNEVNWKHNSEAWVFDHLPNSCLFSQIWVDDARKDECSAVMTQWEKTVYVYRHWFTWWK